MLPDIVSNIERDCTIEKVLSYCHVGQSKVQSDEMQVRYFCPLPQCKGDKRPHFVVDKSRAVDAWGKPIDLSRHVNQGAVVRWHWHCEHSGEDGFGVIELVAAVLGMTTRRESWNYDEWIRVLTECAAIQGLPSKELDPDNRNGYLKVYQPQDEWHISLSDDFSSDAMMALAMGEMRGIQQPRITAALHEVFGCWQVEKYMMAGCYPAGDRSSADMFKSYERRAHALFPIFAFCYDYESGSPLTVNPERYDRKWVARICMPAFKRGDDFDWRGDFWTVFNSKDVNGDLRLWMSGRNIWGDAPVMDAISVNRALSVLSKPEIEAYQGRTVADIAGEIGEEIVTECEIEVVDESAKRPKTTIESVPKSADDLRLRRCVLCRTPLDAVSTYLWLNFPRAYFTKDGVCSSRHYRNDYWHVAWKRMGDMVLNTFEAMDLLLVADDTFQLFGNSRDEIAAGNSNSLRFNKLRLCFLPTSMAEMPVVDSGFFGKSHIPHTPRDFFRYYEPTDNEQTRNMLIVGSTTGMKALMLQKELNASSAVRPFVRIEKSRRRPGEKSYTYDVDLNAAWKMMENAGYCRSIRRGNSSKRRDTIGQCYRIDGHFVYELTPESVMADMRTALEDYAKDNAAGDPEEVELMMNAMLKCKALQDSRPIAVTRLPLMPMPRSESYGPALDYFFFRNGALEITPKSITFRSYRDLDFLIYRSQVLPYDYQSPMKYGEHSPISIRIGERWKQMSDVYEAARRDGKHTTDELARMKRDLDDEGAVHQWQIDIRPTEELDDRMVIPMAIRNDDKHNEWLRWWPFLRLLRCFANEDWQREEEGKYIDADRDMVMARLANMMFTIGRCVYRYHGSAQYMPYFMEETTNSEGKAQGGSGKSMLINSFIPCVRNVFKAEAKRLSAVNPDFEKLFAGFVPHYHDIVHIEDLPKMPIDGLFNYASGNFNFRVMYEDTTSIERDEAPMLAISSNFVVQSSDDSGMGRVQLGTFSHYFSRDIPVLGKVGRGFDMIVPGIEFPDNKPQDFDPSFRNQVIYTLAKCCQFCMVATSMKLRATSPGFGVREQIIIRDVKRWFYDWFTKFLQKSYIFNVPISINEIYNDYIKSRKASENFDKNESRSHFYDCMRIYCSHPTVGVSFMPITPFLSDSEVDRSGSVRQHVESKSYLRKSMSWLTRKFIDAEGHLHYARVMTSNYLSTTGHAVWFSKVGEEPKSEEEMLDMCRRFEAAPDPDPVLDENGQPVGPLQYSDWTMLNTEEDAEEIRRSGGAPRRVSAPVPPVSNNGGGDFPVPSELAPPDSLPY